MFALRIALDRSKMAVCFLRQRPAWYYTMMVVSNHLARVKEDGSAGGPEGRNHATHPPFAFEWHSTIQQLVSRFLDSATKERNEL